MAIYERRGTQATHAPTDLGWWLKHGAIGGLIAGIVFAMFEMIVAALMMGMSAFWMPMRMIGGIVLGMPALDPSYPLVTAALTGFILHMVLSTLYGVIFGAVVSFIPQLARSTAILVVAASVFGLLLWLVNFFVIAPAAGWTWFPEKTSPLVQFIAHTFFYGTALGVYLNWAGARRGVQV
jgi:hypothetical protein